MAKAPMTPAEKKKKEAAAAALKAQLEAMTPEQRSAHRAEEKVANFKRLANKRVPNAVKGIKNVTNLTGATYSWSPEQAEKILNLLNDAIDELEMKLTKTKSADVKADAAPLFV